MTGLIQLQSQAAIASAIRAQDPAKFAAFFDDEVELSIPDLEQILKKEDAQKVITEFFNSIEVVSFDFKHSGRTSDGKSLYCIGALKTKRGAFRVFVYYEDSSEAPVIKVFRIETDQ
ncbi:MAG: DUF4783 domain-containing protein [Saprospiraceae bacterium]|nr:DUF4783 domain-containing protein [Saprospiraceae bacterium]